MFYVTYLLFLTERNESVWHVSCLYWFWFLDRTNHWTALVRNFANALVLVLAFGCSAFADSITVQNPSFEIPILSLGGNSGQVGNGTGTWIPYAPGWPGSAGGGAGEYLPATTSLPTGATDGQDVLYVDFGYVQQTLTAVLQNNTTYTLQVDVAQRADFSPISYYIDLMAGNTILAADNSSLHPASGTWLTSTITYTSGPDDPLAGQALSIVIGVNKNQTDFDNVRLNAVDPLSDAPGQPVPEPGSIFLVGCGLGTTAVAKLRRRK